MILARLIRTVTALALLVALAACDAKDMGEPPRPMGNFKMNAIFIDAKKAQTVPLSRTAKPEDWEAAMSAAMTERFGTYAGDKPFEFGISIDGYVLAPRGVPVVASPKSALIIRLHVYDSAKKQFLEEGGKRITVMEGVSGESFVGSGWTQNKQAQMKKLARNAAKAVQEYMLDHPEWLGFPPNQTPSPAHTNSSTKSN
ncbi:MAG: hypothetical protein RIR04_743 [Pseudomonadota bacterium]